MQQKKLILLYKKYLPIFLVGVFSFLVNYYYGFIGVMPMDNFVLYNGGYRVLNGYIPFNDYWLVTGPLLDYLNALFFYINGTNWKSFIMNRSYGKRMESWIRKYPMRVPNGLSISDTITGMNWKTPRVVERKPIVENPDLWEDY